MINHLVLLNMNLIPQLSNFLKYGLIGLGAIIAILSYLLLKGEQAKRSKKSSTINGIYAFMGLGVVLVLIGLIAPNDQGKQSSNINIEGSRGNTVDSKQEGVDSGSQDSKVTLSKSDSNKVSVHQQGSKDTLIVEKP